MTLRFRRERAHHDKRGAARNDGVNIGGEAPPPKSGKSPCRYRIAGGQPDPVYHKRGHFASGAVCRREHQPFPPTGGNISFGSLGVGGALTLNVKNGDISGAVAGSYEEFSIQSEVKKGESNLPDQKDGGEKVLQVSANNGNVEIAFAE